MRTHVVRCGVAILVLGLSSFLVVGKLRAQVPVLPEGLPLSFTENQGQWDTPARFVAFGKGLVAGFDEDTIVLQLEKREGSASTFTNIRMTLENASKDVRLEGSQKRRAVSHYFRGSDPARWRTDVPQYSRLFYRDFREGIDLCVRADSGRLEYDVLLDPGADLDPVVVRCDGVERLSVDEDGSLWMHTALGSVRQPVPTTWTTGPAGEKTPVTCRYRLLDEHRYGFRVEGRDPGLPLVIDPELEWSTFLGGTGVEDIYAVHEEEGLITVAGWTSSLDFPVPNPNVYDPIPSANRDGFIARFDPSLPPAEQLLWTTFLGGVGLDIIYDLAVDDDGVLTVAGWTASDDFPTVGALQPLYGGGGADGFVARLDPALSGVDQLVASTFLGHAGQDWITALDVDDSGEVTVGGFTTSPSFPTVGAYDSSYNGGRDAFLARIDPALSDLQWSTFLGGSSAEGFYGAGEHTVHWKMLDVDVDADGVVTVAGRTQSTNFPTVFAHDPSFNGVGDGFVSRLDPALSGPAQLVWSTYLGGVGWENVYRLHVDLAGIVTVGGSTMSSNFPTTLNAFDETFNGPAGFNDAFLSRFDPTLNPADQLVYSTFLGGAHGDWEHLQGNIVVDEDSVVTFAGHTTAPDFPVTPDAFQPSIPLGAGNGFLVRLSPDGGGATDLLYSTFLGGGGIDGVVALTMAGPEVVVLGGMTTSSDFPVTPDAYDTTFDGCASPCGFLFASDAFVSIFDFAGPEFRRGDINQDGSLDIGDPIAGLSILFTGAPASTCDDSTDVNDDGLFDIGDAIYLLSSLFVPGSPPPPAPGWTCGIDPTVDGLLCVDYPSCP